MTLTVGLVYPLIYETIAQNCLGKKLFFELLIVNQNC